MPWKRRKTGNICVEENVKEIKNKIGKEEKNIWSAWNKNILRESRRHDSKIKRRERERKELRESREARKWGLEGRAMGKWRGGEAGAGWGGVGMGWVGVGKETWVETLSENLVARKDAECPDRLSYAEDCHQHINAGHFFERRKEEEEEGKRVKRGRGK